MKLTSTRRLCWSAGVLGTLALTTIAGAADEMQCSALLNKIDDAEIKIDSAEFIGADKDIPEHCDVRGTIGGNNGFALLLPTEWNGRFVMAGNGGKAGNLELNAAKSFLTSNYAAATTNTGHDSSLPDQSGAKFGTDADMEQDFGHRAVHETAVASKSIISAYYPDDLKNSFWVGCSTGGRQGLMEAQRYPDDFNGYVVGAPVYNYTLEQMTAPAMLRNLYTSDPYTEEPVVSASKIELLGKHVYEKCDAVDGLEDGLITDPRACDFAPSRDLPKCTADGGDACFTEKEITALEGIYAGVAVNGKILVPGMPLGSENIPGGWLAWLVPGEGTKSPPSPILHTIMIDSFNYLMFEDDRPDYKYMTDFDFNTDPQKLSAAEVTYNATDPDLLDVEQKGAKIIMYHGWSDPAVNPLNTIDYYDQVKQNMQSNGGSDVNSFMKLYLVPGMGHCRGGVGFDQTDWLTPLRAWVEDGVAPDAVSASRASDGASRIQCPYPQKAVYQGSGDMNDAANFTCSD